MLLEMPVDIRFMILWDCCTLLDSVRLDYDTVRALRLTCRALYSLLNDERRWNRLAQRHYEELDTSSVRTFTDYARFPFTVPFVRLVRTFDEGTGQQSGCYALSHTLTYLSVPSSKIVDNVVLVNCHKNNCL